MFSFEHILCNEIRLKFLLGSNICFLGIQPEMISLKCIYILFFKRFSK